METRQLGKTGLRVTALGFGAMELRHMEEEPALTLLDEVLNAGITYIDTSPDYRLSERYIGLAGRRNEYILATKCGCHVDDGGNSLIPPHIWSRDMLLTNIENSLRFLDADRIDVWQLHGVTAEELPGGTADEVIKTMQELKSQRVIGHIGVSFLNARRGALGYPAGYSYDGLRAFMDWGVFDTMQVVYGGLTRKNELVISEAAKRGIGIIVRGVLKRYEDNYDALYEQAALSELHEPGEDRSSFLIRFALSHPDISTMIVGTGNPAHLRANVAAASRGPLTRDVYAEAKRRLDAVGIVAEPV